MNIPARYTATAKKFEGGMSSAAIFHDQHLDRDVVVKTLLPGADQARLMDEIKSLSTIRSKHVVEIYDVIKDKKGNIVGLIEEFCAGDDLSVKLGKVDAEEFLDIIFSISSGLADIHAHGQIHRDIKPNNMKYDLEGCLKIFDFGLARTENVDAATTGAVGTIGYIAPELCVKPDEVAKFTQAVGVFAFASTALKLVRGSIPKSLRVFPLDLSSEECDFGKQKIALPQAVAAILNRCHSVDPMQRPKMAEVRDLVAAEILRDKHRAFFVINGKVHSINSVNRTVNVTSGSLGAFTMSYDGTMFHVSPTAGAVYVNNTLVTDLVALPGSCVITLGGPAHGLDRVFVPVDVSHPEVIS